MLDFMSRNYANCKYQDVSPPLVDTSFIRMWILVLNYRLFPYGIRGTLHSHRSPGGATPTQIVLHSIRKGTSNISRTPSPGSWKASFQVIKVRVGSCVPEYT